MSVPMPHKDLNIDRAQLQALGEYFAREAEKKKNGTTPAENAKEKRPKYDTKASEGLRGLAARTNSI